MGRGWEGGAGIKEGSTNGQLAKKGSFRVVETEFTGRKTARKGGDTKGKARTTAAKHTSFWV